MFRLLPAVMILALAAPSAAAVPGPDKKLAGEIDKVMSEIYKPGEPGAAVIVRRGGRTLFRKGYGLADLELGVRVEPDMIFRLGSITKQFTAVAILMLAEQGKLSLKDELGKYLPAFPTGDKKVTIEHLLTHTSGIKSYTNMEEWLQLWRKDMTPQEIMTCPGQAFEFTPGPSWNYNNSSYVMLGHHRGFPAYRTSNSSNQDLHPGHGALCYGIPKDIRARPGYQRTMTASSTPYLR
jgi:CubicO group peptidase (beta-lactamase class C family)